jgi:hypothetical protein
MKVGATVFVKKTGDNARHYRNNNLEIPVDEYRISKIGRKYFYLDGYLKDVKFCIENHVEVTQFSSGYKAYFSLQAIEDEKEYRKKASDISSLFNGYGGMLKASLEDLRVAHSALIKPKQEPEA